MQILITGADGFAGQHLIRTLSAENSADQLHGTTFRELAAPLPNVSYHTLDLRDEHAVAQLVSDLRPQQIYHLAAQANVGQSYRCGLEHARKQHPFAVEPDPRLP